MMKNKVIEMMAKDWNAYTDAFGKKDNCVYVVVDNSNDSVEKFYKSWKGAYSYIEKTYDKFAYGLSKKGIVIVERKEVEDYIKAMETEKKEEEAPTYNVGDVIEGYLSVGDMLHFGLRLAYSTSVGIIFSATLHSGWRNKRHSSPTFAAHSSAQFKSSSFWMITFSSFARLYASSRGADFCFGERHTQSNVPEKGCEPEVSRNIANPRSLRD